MVAGMLFFVLLEDNRVRLGRISNLSPQRAFPLLGTRLYLVFSMSLTRILANYPSYYLVYVIVLCVG